MGKRTFTAIIHEEGEGMFSATCPEAGTKSQGSSEDKALKNLIEATELYFTVVPYKKQGAPVFKTFEVNVKEPEESEEGP
jgi:predicted RNase H-like HicB family nuclease